MELTTKQIDELKAKIAICAVCGFKFYPELKEATATKIDNLCPVCEQYVNSK